MTNQNSNELTELSVTMDELGLSRKSYSLSLHTLSDEQLREECLRQYDLSGEMLSKYRSESTKLYQTRDALRAMRHEMATLRNQLTWLSSRAMSLVSVASAVSIIIETSKGYTHSMKRTAGELIKDMLQPEITNLEATVKAISENEVQLNSKYGDIPF